MVIINQGKYGHESWTMIKNALSRVQVSEIRFLVKIKSKYALGRRYIFVTLFQSFSQLEIKVNDQLQFINADRKETNNC